MSSNLSLYETDLNFYFVLEDKNAELSDELVYAHKKLGENVREGNIIDLSPTECLEMLKKSTKRDIFIFEKFEGEAFQAAANTKSLVLGPRCLISCLIDNVSVPNISSPIFTMAMKGLIISMSSISVSEKKSLEKLVNYMGGRCIPQLTDQVTHLVTNNVKSAKYEQAALLKKAIMKPEWVTDAWNQSRHDNILATNPLFDVHCVPIFYNLGFTSTGIDPKIRSKIKDAVEANGGKYYGGYSSHQVDILIAEKNQKATDKLKAAIQGKKDCLTPQWVFDSLEKGFALPILEYKIDLQAKKITSTPQKSVMENMTELTDISCISGVNQVNETALSAISSLSNIIPIRPSGSNGNRNQQDPTYKATLEKLNISEAKKAGLFLDGCNIFVCGFSTEEKEKIYKILNRGGATRYETINSNVSHVIVGMPMKKDLELLNAKKTDAVCVTLDWLADSIQQKQSITDCEPYVYQIQSSKSKEKIEETVDAPSPASKKNILSMTGNFKVPKPKRLDFKAAEREPENNEGNKSVFKMELDIPNGENLEDLLLDQYINAEPSVTTVEDEENVGKQVEQLQNQSDKPDNSESENQYTYEFTEEPSFLINLTVHFRGFDEESTKLLIKDCEAAGANVILDENYQGIVDYLIVSMDILSLEDIKIKAKNVVNHNWLINAKKNNHIGDIPYYYKPIIFDEELKPLGNMMIVFSLYSNDERAFLVQLAQILGAVCEDSYKRINKPLLICPEPNNAKYNAAIKWGLPVVTHEWLLECYKQEGRVSLKDYLVGDSILPIDDEVSAEIVNEQTTKGVENVVEPIAVDENLEGAAALPPVNKVHENVAAGDDKYTTPTNKRLNALRKDELPSTSPRTKRQRAENDEKLLSCLDDTPTRECVREIFKNAPPDTPNTRWIRRTGGTLPTPEIPECMKTPFREKQKSAFWDERRELDEWAEEEYQRTKKQSTPWTEHRRKFWRQALGDRYESPSQCYNENTQFVKFCDENLQKHLADESFTEALEDDEHIKKLNYLINNRPTDSDENDEKMNMLPETAPTMSDIEIPNTQPNERVGWHDPSDISLITPKRLTNVKKYRGTPVFSISCASDEVKLKTLEQIKGLGGKICANILNYDKSCTHMVCEKLNRGEKIFSCIAAGKWVLGLDYIKDSVDAGHFLNEELYEWGNPKAINLPQPSPAEQDLVAAVYRSRSSLQTDPHDIPPTGLFKDFNMILRVSKSDNFKNLVEAGGGKVTEISEPYRLEDLEGVTHFIGQPKGFPPLSADSKANLDKANIVCVKINFLSACITSPEPPNPVKFELK